jgi:hypothetical protein
MIIRILLVGVAFIVPMLLAFWFSPDGSDLPLIVLAVELLPLIAFLYWGSKQPSETGAGRRAKKNNKNKADASPLTEGK